MTKDISQIDFTDLLVAIWRRRFLVAVITIAFTIIGVLYAVLSTPIYTAKVTILPQPGATTSDLLSKVALFTGNVSASSVNYENLYGEIVKSDNILERVIDRKWVHKDYEDSVTTIDLFGLLPKDSGDPKWPHIREKAKMHLRANVIGFSRDDLTGYMTLTASIQGDPQSAADMANYVVGELEEFIFEWRSHKAREQRLFIENRLLQVENDLYAAERQLTVFLEQNRNYAASPMLRQEFSELDREVQAQQSMWIELRRQLELAKIEENRDTVSVNVLDRARAPIGPSKPKKAIVVIVTAFMGFIMSLIVLVARYEIGMLRKRNEQETTEAASL